MLGVKYFGQWQRGLFGVLERLPSPASIRQSLSSPTPLLPTQITSPFTSILSGWKQARQFRYYPLIRVRAFPPPQLGVSSSSVDRLATSRAVHSYGSKKSGRDNESRRREDAEKAVHAAIAGNGLLTLCKLSAFTVTGSGAMLSEAIHSLADLANQLLLAIGIRQSKKRPDQDHPYGYQREQFVWALMSAMGIFCLGSGVTIYHGITTFLEPEPLVSLPLAYAVLGASLLVEGATLGMAYRAVRRGAEAQNMRIGEYLESQADPMAVAVLLEDGAAVLGVFIAAGSLGMVSLTGDPRWDGVGSIAIGTLLGAVAVYLIRRNRRFLVGANIPSQQYRKITSVLAKDLAVERVHDVKAEMMGTDSVRFKAEIEFNGAEIARKHLESMGRKNTWENIKSMKDEKQLERFLMRYGSDLIGLLGAEVDRLEAKIRETVPAASHIDLEAHMREGFKPALLQELMNLTQHIAAKKQKEEAEKGEVDGSEIKKEGKENATPRIDG